MEPKKFSEHPSKTWLRPTSLKLMLAALGLVLATILFLILPVKTYVAELLSWIQALGAWGPVLFIGVYAIACLLFFPAWILTVGAGLVYGLGWGAAWVALGATLGCVASFVIGRTLARDRLALWVEKHPRWSALDQALGQGGFALIFLLRLSPVFPFAVLNYVLGLTRVSLKTYLAASCLGMLPGLFLYVYLGTAAHSLTEITARRTPGTPGQTVFFWLGLLATALVVVLVTRLAGRSLKIPNANSRIGGNG